MSTVSSASARKLEAAKAAVLDRVGDERWCRGVGVGRVDDMLGIVISVSPSGKEAVEAILAELRPGVPTRVRVLGAVRKRPRDRAG